MSKIYKTRNTCRLCNSKNLELVVPLGLSPVSEKYLTKDNLSVEQIRVPLNLYFCQACTHVQLLDIVNPDFLWADFTFKTSNNPKLISHFKDYAQRVVSILPLSSDDLIVDVGSNDGTLLQCFSDMGFGNVLGVDPAEEIANDATDRGIQTKFGYMNSDMAHQIVRDFGQAHLITANNVYAHVDDLSGMTDAITYLLREDGLFVFEVSYFLDVVEKNLIGTIFHEHLSYHSIRSIQPFLLDHGLELIHVERGPEQGGSLIGYAQFKDGPHYVRESVDTLLTLEENFKLGVASTVRDMYRRLEIIKNDVKSTTSRILEEGLTIAGFGAARAGTTLLSYFEIGNQLEYLVDDNEGKHFKYSPGDHLEVLPPSEIYSRNPGYLLILAWIHADKIIESHRRYLDEGGAFIRIFPNVEIICAERDY